MGLFDWAKSIFGVTKASAPLPSPGTPLLLTWEEDAPPTAKRLLELYNSSIEFRTVVDALATRFASVPFYPATDEGELPKEHPLSIMNVAPVPGEMSGQQQRKLEQSWIDILDESFTRIGEDNGRFWAVPMPPHRVKVKSENGVRVYEFKAPNGERIIYSDEEVVWSRHHGIVDPYDRPCGKGFAAADEVETAEFAAKYHKAFFRNDATPSQIIGVEGANQASLEAFAKSWREKHQGNDKSFATAFVSGKLNSHQTQMPLRDLSVLEIRKAAADAVRRLYNIPPEVVGEIENSNRATITEALAILAEMALLPRLRFRAQEWDIKALPRLEAMGMDVSGIYYTFVDPTPVDFQQRLEAAKANPTSLTQNEWRQLQGLQPRAGQDVYVVNPTQYLPIESQDIISEDEMKSSNRDVVKAMDGAVLMVIDGGHVDRKSAEEDVAIILESLEPEVVEMAWAQAMRDGLEAWALAEAATLSFDMTQAMLNPFVAEFMEQQGARFITQVSDTTKKEVRETLIKGIREGKGTRDLAKMLRESSTFSRARSELIAVTETNGAINAAKSHVYKINPAVDKVEWVAAFRNTRPSHAFMDGQVRPLGVPFVSGKGNTTLSPGRFGIAAEDCRCKCTIVASFDEKDFKSREFIAKSHDKLVDDAADPFTQSMYEALQKQLEEQVIPALVRVRGEEIAI